MCGSRIRRGGTDIRIESGVNFPAVSWFFIRDVGCGWVVCWLSFSTYFTPLLVLLPLLPGREGLLLVKRRKGKQAERHGRS